MAHPPSISSLCIAVLPAGREGSAKTWSYEGVAAELPATSAPVTRLRYRYYSISGLSSQAALLEKFSGRYIVTIEEWPERALFAEPNTMADDKDCNAADESKGQPLGDYLANVRAAKQMSLREVEEAADGIVSNAYLSQLEHGRIGKPSPNILHCLARVYGVPYETLMQKAGYIVATSNESGSKRHGRVATFAKQNLTNDEEEALLEYLAFLRSKKGRKPT